MFTFGRGNHGQLGHGNRENIQVPRLIYFFKDKKATDIAGGFYHTIILVNDRYPRVNSLSFDMRKLLNDPSRCDVSFKVESEMYHANRWIILARCKALNRHITSEAKESDVVLKENIGTNWASHKVLEIQDCQPEAFKILLEFIYTGMVQNVPEFDSLVLLDVFCLALRYRIKKLVCECEEYLLKNIWEENAAAILCKTEKLDDEAEKLRETSHDYIIENFGSVIKTQEFLNLPKEILGQIFSKASELGVKVNPHKTD